MRILVRSLLAAALLAASAGRTPADGAPAAPGPLGPGQEGAIVEALQDEYRGEALYARVLETLGEVRPFSRVVLAERRHAAFLEDLLRSRDLPVPASRWAGEEGPTYASRPEACAAALEFEAANVALYDRLLAADGLPADVAAAFEHNRRASRDHHQPAFARCAGAGDGARRGQAVAGCGGRGHGPGAGPAARGPCRGRCPAGRGPGGRQGRCRRGAGATAAAPGESGS